MIRYDLEMIPGYNDFRQTAEYACFMKKGGWIAWKSHCYTTDFSPIYLYLWRIPIVGGTHLSLHRVPPTLDIEKINNLAITANTFVIRIDFNAQSLPSQTLSQLRQYNFTQTNWCNAPTKTKIVQLQQFTDEDIFNQFKPKLRYNIRLAKKRASTVHFFTYNQLKNKRSLLTQFSNLLYDRKKTNGIEAMTVDELLMLFRCFGKKALLAVVEHEEVIISAGIFLISNSVMSYTQNASTTKGKKLFAPSLVLWEAIKLAKKLNLKYFDFEGITDERNPHLTHSWEGFTKFKSGFGGSDVEQELPYQKLFLKDDMLGKLKDHFRKEYLKYRILPSIYPSETYV